MIFRCCLLFFSFLFLSNLEAEVPQISLLTCDSGDELYSTFGHSAIRVKHEATKYDVVYGWGTFDQSQKGFYLKFMRGKLLYYMSVTSYDRFLAEYNYFKRGVEEQILDLDSLETYQMIEVLERNIKEENRYYKYDFFFDNCSTRIRDVLESHFNVDFKKIKGDKTYRNLLDEKLTSLVWSDFGIDIVIGAVADRRSDYRNQMFLPEYLKNRFAEATLSGEELVKSTSTILDFPKAKLRRDTVPFFTPFKLFMALLFLLLVCLLWVNPMTKKVFNITSFLWILMMTIFSLIIIFLWFFTDHIATKENWNLIWISPLFVVALIRFRSLCKTMGLQFLLFGIILLNLLMLIIWSLIPQQLHLAFIPMIVISILIAVVKLRDNVRDKGWVLKNKRA